MLTLYYSSRHRHSRRTRRLPPNPFPHPRTVRNKFLWSRERNKSRITSNASQKTGTHHNSHGNQFVSSPRPFLPDPQSLLTSLFFFLYSIPPRHPRSRSLLRQRLGPRRILRQPRLRNRSLQHKNHHCPTEHRNPHLDKSDHGCALAAAICAAKSSCAAGEVYVRDAD